MDEYQLEITELRRRLARLKFEHAPEHIIEELEAELAILRALYASASNLLAAGEENPRLRAAFRQQGFGPWTLENVYFYVYEEATAIDPQGHDLAALIAHHDFAGRLLVPAGQDLAG
jgi:hypothetical protein